MNNEIESLKHDLMISNKHNNFLRKENLMLEEERKLLKTELDMCKKLGLAVTNKMTELQKENESLKVRENKINAVFNNDTIEKYMPKKQSIIKTFIKKILW